MFFLIAFVMVAVVCMSMRRRVRVMMVAAVAQPIRRLRGRSAEAPLRDVALKQHGGTRTIPGIKMEAEHDDKKLFPFARRYGTNG